MCTPASAVTDYVHSLTIGCTDAENHKAAGPPDGTGRVPRVEEEVEEGHGHYRCRNSDSGTNQAKDAESSQDTGGSFEKETRAYPGPLATRGTCHCMDIAGTPP